MKGGGRNGGADEGCLPPFHTVSNGVMSAPHSPCIKWCYETIYINYVSKNQKSKNKLKNYKNIIIRKSENQKIKKPKKNQKYQKYQENKK